MVALTEFCMYWRNLAGALDLSNLSLNITYLSASSEHTVGSFLLMFLEPRQSLVDGGCFIHA